MIHEISHSSAVPSSDRASRDDALPEDAVGRDSVPRDSALRDTVGRSVVLPVYAEDAASVSQFARELRRAGWDEVVVCVDAPDSTARRAFERLAGRSGVTISLSDARRGKGGALVDGLNATTGDVVGFVDADGAVSVEDLDRLYRLAESTGDVAVGSRDLLGSRRGQPLVRRALAVGYRRAARSVTGVPVEDFQCGAKAMRRDVWERVAGSITETGFAFDTDLLARVHAEGVGVREVPVDWRDPGDSAVRPVRDTADMLGALIRIRRSLSEGAPRRDRPLRVALVSAHPPNRGHLAEYGEELAKAFAARPDVEPVVFAQTVDGAPRVERFDGYEVRRVWGRDSVRGAVDLVRRLRAGRFDVVHFNIHMTYFGDTNVHRFVGLSLPPLLSRALDARVVTTMHDFLEVVEDEVVDESVGAIERAGAYAATQLLLLGDVTTVTSEEYRSVIADRYYAPNLHHVPHGTFVRADGGAPRISDPYRILVFGHLGPTKDIGTVVEAFARVRERIPDAELVVAGGSHPGFPGYRAELAERYGDEPGVEFVGYVEEEDMDGVWHGASVALMPYRTCTGVSGVFHLAKSYGRPVVASDVEGMRVSTIGTGGAASFVPPGDPEALARELCELRDDPDHLAGMGRTNAAAASEYTIAESADRFVELFTA
jgi:glycosyltransferase involved in cell wall biosynthesis/CTP:molybdopterin cytidylyltransferase MocA